MLQDSADVPLQRRRRRTCFRFGALILAGLACLALSGTSALAQTDLRPHPPSSGPSAICDVRADATVMEALESAKPVIANCRGHGLILGQADEFEVFTHEASQSVLVDLRFGVDRKVLLISLQNERAPLLEDISGQISMAVGRGPLSNLEGLEIDASGFVLRGRLGVQSRTDDAGRPAQTSSIDLGQQIAASRLAREVRSAQD